MRLMTTNYCTEAATSIVASSADPSFPVSNLKHPFRSKRWRSTGVSNETLTFDLITTEEIDSVVLLWPKEDGIRLSSTAELRIQANATNVWTAPAVDQVLTISNDYVLASHYFATAQSYRFWRVVIQDAGNPNGFVEIGVVWLGKGLEIENAQNGFKYQLVDQTKITKTDFGHQYADVYPQLAVLDFTYQYLDYDSVQVLENAFRTNGAIQPVLVVLDPLGEVFDKDHFTVYGKFKPTFGNQHVRYDILNLDGITVQELA